MKIKDKKKGFTLVELLAALVILGLLTTIAAPNIIGILQNTKLTTYTRDAEKIVTLAEYKFRSDNSIVKPATGNCIIMNMKFLGSGEFQNAPYGGSYTYQQGSIDTENNNFVVIKRVSGGSTVKYEYYVQLLEYVEKKHKYSGIPLTSYNKVKNDSPVDIVDTGITSTPVAVTQTSPTTITVGGSSCTVQARYAA